MDLGLLYLFGDIVLGVKGFHRQSGLWNFRILHLRGIARSQPDLRSVKLGYQGQTARWKVTGVIDAMGTYPVNDMIISLIIRLMP